MSDVRIKNCNDLCEAFELLTNNRYAIKLSYLWEEYKKKHWSHTKNIWNASYTLKQDLSYFYSCLFFSAAVGQDAKCQVQKLSGAFWSLEEIQQRRESSSWLVAGYPATTSFDVLHPNGHQCPPLTSFESLVCIPGFVTSNDGLIVCSWQSTAVTVCQCACFGQLSQTPGQRGFWERSGGCIRGAVRMSFNHLFWRCRHDEPGVQKHLPTSTPVL